MREGVPRLEEGLRARMEIHLERPESIALLRSVWGNSPFLGGLLLKEPETFLRFVEEGPDAALDAWREQLCVAHPEQEGEAMRVVRVAKRQLALLAGLADMTGRWPLEQVTGAITECAERTLQVSLEFLLRRAQMRGLYQPKNPERPADDSGFIVLGMGKLGGGELNYSSDIDLIILFDRERLPLTDPSAAQKFCVSLTQDLVRLMQERTPDGYVFRTDLRLRPDPSSTPAALSTLAALTYYESQGQNWERAAMIKARPVAGDLAAGEAFLHELRPFIWRKSLDFAAIEDIKSVKRQIDARHGAFTADLYGHNIKLGHGGIREIEFFVQTQQLIWGGRKPALRTRATVPNLALLTAEGLMTSKVAEELSRAYRLLRTIEHRLQMREDQQTHSLPTEEEGFVALAAFAGYASVGALRADLLRALTIVQRHFAALFRGSPNLGQEGNLVFTGSDDDPETLQTLKRLGFSDPHSVADRIRNWHYGKVRATRTKRARELLTELAPALLRSLANTANPDAAFARFDDFIRDLPAGLQLFSLLYSNPSLLKLLADVMGSAPHLAGMLARYPALFDAVLAGDFFAPLPDRVVLRARLAERLRLSVAYEESLEICRRFHNEQQFRAGIHLLKSLSTVDQVFAMLSDLADVVVEAVLACVRSEFAESYGLFEGGEMVILGLGKLGGQELGFGSDIDMMCVYDVADGVFDRQSSGPKQVGPRLYFERLVQRLVTALTQLTPEGRLFEVDMRLRPHGNDGPIAVTRESFERYYSEQAWHFEYMALTRARVVAGDARLARGVMESWRARLCVPRDAAQLASDMREMREKVAAQYPARDPWNLKYARGGLMDVAFIVQYLLLIHAEKAPDILTGHTIRAVEHLHEQGFVESDMAALLVEAARSYSSLQAILRLSAVEGFTEEQAGDGLRQAIARALATPSFEEAREKLVGLQTRVAACFAEVFG